MSPLRRFANRSSRQSTRSQSATRRSRAGRNLRIEPLEHRTVFSVSSPVTTLGAATMLTTDLPATSQTGAVNGQGVSYGNGYASLFAPQPNVTPYFRASELAIQSSDWWSSIMFRTLNGPTVNNGYAANSNVQIDGKSTYFTNVTDNNLAYPLFADPLILQVDTASSVAGGITTFSPRGLAIGYAGSYANQGVNSPGQNTDAIVMANFNQDLLVGLVDGSGTPISSADIAVDNYSDWAATFAWSNGQSGAGAASITATAANGSPFVYFTTAGGNEVRIAVTGQSAGPSLAYLSPNGRVAVVIVPNGPEGVVTNNNAYALFAPEGGAWVYAAANGSTPATLSMQLTGANATASYFSAAILPREFVTEDASTSAALLETFRQHAYAFILGPAATRAGGLATTLGTQVLEIDYVESTSSVATRLGVTTRLMDTSDATLVNGSMMALYPHQAKNLSDPGDLAPLTDGLHGPQFTYNSGKGPMRLFTTQGLGQASAVQTTEFSTSMFYHGVVPYLPNALTVSDAATRDQLIEYIHDVATGEADVRAFPFPGISDNLNFISTDTNYPAGKHMLRVGLLLPLIDQLVETTSDPGKLAQLNADRLELLSQLKTAVSNFFDVGGYEWVAYNDTWDTVIPYPDDNGTATNLNDKHFKWGYFLRAAALIARYDADFISPSNYGPILQLIARDAANWDRTATGDFELPYLRNFNPYAGHSWANGDGVSGQGNNQESSGEAINFAVGLIQLGEAYRQFDAATGDKIREMGIYLFTTETESIAQYYFNVDQDNYPDNFTLNYATVMTQSAMTDTATTVTVAGATFPLGFPHGADDTYRIRLENETMLVTGRTGNVLTVLRGYDGSVPLSHAAGVGLSLLDPYTTLVGALGASDTSATVSSYGGFPPPPAGGATQFRFKVRIDDEIIAVVGGAGSTSWTLLRGQDGTTAATHSVGASVILYGQSAPWGNLDGQVQISDTTISYASSPALAAFPNPATRPFQIEIGGERMLVVGAPSAGTWSVIRGYAGTMPLFHVDGARFRLVTRESSWTTPDTTLTAGIGTTDTTLDVDTTSSAIGGFGDVADTINTTTANGELFTFSTTLAQAISDSSSVIDIHVTSVPAAISNGAMFFVRIGTGPTQSTYFVQNVLNAPFTEWNVKLVGTYHAQSAGSPVELVWLSGTTAGDPSLIPTLILDPSTLPEITSSLAPFKAVVAGDVYDVSATMGTANNIWQITAALAQDYTGTETVYSGITAGTNVIAVESLAGFPTQGSFRILVGSEIMLVQGTYFDVQLNEYIPNMWSVLRGYGGTQAVDHVNLTGSTITLVDPEQAFTIQIGDERLSVVGKRDSNTWVVLRGVDGTTTASHGPGATVALAEIAPITRADITGRLYGAGPQKAIFFSTPAMDREASIRMIQSLPISGASLYLGHLRNADGSATIASQARTLAAFEQFLINAQVYPGQVNAGGVYPGTIWGLQALADPLAALAHFNAFLADNYGYNIVEGTVAAQPLSAGDSSVLVAPPNGVFPIPPDNTAILTYFKVGFGGSSDTLLVDQMQLNADTYGNTRLTGTRTGGASQPFGQKVIPVDFSAAELGDVSLAADLDWGATTVYIKDNGNNPFPSVAGIGVAENVRFYVRVQFLVNSAPVTENWLVTSQTRTSANTRTWTVEREIVPLSEAINLADTKLLTNTSIEPVSAFLKVNVNSGLDEGESAANTYAFINQLIKLGTPDPSVVAVGASSFAVFKNASGQRTYAVYNDSAAVLPTVSFYEVGLDGQLGTTPFFTFNNVLARSYFQYSEATTQETIESIPYIDIPAAPNQFYLLNTQGNNPSNLANGMSSGASSAPGGDVTSLLTLPTAGAGNYNYTGGTSFVINNVSGTYDSTAATTRFQLYTVNGSTQTYSGTQPGVIDSVDSVLPASAAYSAIVRVSYYAAADASGTPFRVELFNESTFGNPDASSPNNTYDTYTDAVGIHQSTGSYQNMTGGSIKVEVWLYDTNGGTGTQAVGLKVGTPLELDPQASRIEIPYLNVSTTGPGITGTVADQPIADHAIIDPFATVAIANPSDPAQQLDVLVEIVTPGDGAFTDHSLLFSGFVEQAPGTGKYTFSGTAAEATGAIQQLQFRATQTGAAVGTTRDVPFRITVEQQGGQSITDNTTSVLATNTAPSNAGYVQSLFAKLLGRNPDANELANFVDQMDNGLSRASVLNSVLVSRERREYQVEEFYHRYLGRPSDAWGKPQWVELLIDGAAEEDVIAGFLASNEFRAARPTVADEVDGFYETLLGRAPDSFGEPQWIALLDQGATADAVVRQFLISQEYLGLTVDRYFTDWLGRLPTQFERTFFVERATTAGGLNGVATLLLFSDEFWEAS